MKPQRVIVVVHKSFELISFEKKIFFHLLATQRKKFSLKTNICDHVDYGKMNKSWKLELCFIDFTNYSK